MTQKAFSKEKINFNSLISDIYCVFWLFFLKITFYGAFLTQPKFSNKNWYDTFFCDEICVCLCMKSEYILLDKYICDNFINIW